VKVRLYSGRPVYIFWLYPCSGKATAYLSFFTNVNRENDLDQKRINKVRQLVHILYSVQATRGAFCTIVQVMTVY
jgi:hypothetical protein